MCMDARRSGLESWLLKGYNVSLRVRSKVLDSIRVGQPSKIRTVVYLLGKARANSKVLRVVPGAPPQRIGTMSPGSDTP